MPCKTGYKSDAQRRLFHAKAKRGEISKKTVERRDKKSKGKDLPERVKESSMEPGDLTELEKRGQGPSWSHARASARAQGLHIPPGLDDDVKALQRIGRRRGAIIGALIGGLGAGGLYLGAHKLFSRKTGQEIEGQELA